MTKLLTFAPPEGAPGATVWVCDDRSCTAMTVAGALVVLFEPDEMVVFAPGEAGPGDETVVPLPDCDSEAGLWACFEAFCGAVGEGERLIVDLTHASGPLPFVVFLALPYLRELKGARIERVFYGARAGRAATELPVHDLTPFVEVLDWVGAVQGFLRYLDAGALAALIAGIQDRAHRHRREPPPRQLKPFANNLARFASAVRLARPTEAFLAAHLLLARLDTVEGEVAADIPALRPLVEQIGRLAPLADEEPVLDGDLLRRQRALVRYQLDHGLLLQAVELGREWLVNLLVLRLGCPADRWLDWQVRETVGRTATGAMLARQHRRYDPTALSDRFEALADADGIASVWQAIGELRNDLAHCGMNEQPKAVRVIERRTAAVVAALEALA
ncbi:MAG: TM1812 family CRISPR-associated protein [Methanospirillum sp.]